MKKTLLYSLAALASISLASCAGDYDDWGSPQSNAQEEAKNVTLNITPAAAINFTGLTAEKVNFFDASITAPDNMTATSYQVEVELTDKDGNTVKKTLSADLDGQVATADLKAAVEEVCGKYPTERTVKTTAKANLKCDNGEAFYALSNQVENHVTPENFGTSYKLVIDGTTEVALKTDDESYPEFTAAFEGTQGSTWEIIDENGEAMDEGEFAETAKYKATFNAESASAEVKKAPELYLTGSEYGWSATWKQLTPVYGDDAVDEFWTIIYLSEGEQFKFAPQAAWGNDFGYTGTTINDEAGANITSSDDGNLVVGNAGWYLLHVTNGTTHKLEVLAPNVYLMGDAAGEWNIAESHKFTVPTTKDGVFESPAFAANAELRMCVNFGNYDWWKTEFIVRNGKIEMRGRGGDQEPRVNVTAGQKAYLNFTDGTGEIK